MLPALFGGAEDLVFVGVAFVESFGDGLPVGLFVEGHGLAEQFGLEFGPLVGDQFDLFEAEPSELALLGRGACDEGGDKLPVLVVLNEGEGTSWEWWARACCSTRLQTSHTSSVMSSLFQLRLILRLRSILSAEGLTCSRAAKLSAARSRCPPPGTAPSCRSTPPRSQAPSTPVPQEVLPRIREA